MLEYCWFARDVTAAMLVIKNKSKSLLWGRTKLQLGRPVMWLLIATRNWPGLEPHSREDLLSETCKFQNVVFPRVLTRWSNLPPWRVEDPGVTDA